MSLSQYHSKYSSQPDEEIARRAKVKEEELKRIFDASPLRSTTMPVRVAVMGCGEKRFIQQHRDIFARLLGRSVEVTTFDIAIEHLAGEERVIQHDVTQPLPDGPYDISYAHVLLKFIPTDKQMSVLLNSYNALREGGIAVHVFDNEEIVETSQMLADGLYAVPLERWKSELDAQNIKHQNVSWKIEGILSIPLEGSALIMSKV